MKKIYACFILVNVLIFSACSGGGGEEGGAFKGGGLSVTEDGSLKIHTDIYLFNDSTGSFTKAGSAVNGTANSYSGGHIIGDISGGKLDMTIPKPAGSYMTEATDYEWDFFDTLPPEFFKNGAHVKVWGLESMYLDIPGEYFSLTLIDNPKVSSAMGLHGIDGDEFSIYYSEGIVKISGTNVFTDYGFTINDIWDVELKEGWNVIRASTTGSFFNSTTTYSAKRGPTNNSKWVAE